MSKADVGGSRRVFLIQDLHGHPDVQRTIEGIVDFLHDDGMVTVDDYGRSNLFVEGTWGLVANQPLREIQKEPFLTDVLNSLINDAEIGGAESWAIKHRASLYGVDDEGDYREHLRIMRQFHATSQKDRAMVWARSLRARERIPVEFVESSPVNAIIDRFMDFAAGDADYFEYLGFIMAQARTLRISLDRDFPQLAKWRHYMKGTDSPGEAPLKNASAEIDRLTYQICWEYARTKGQTEALNQFFGNRFLLKLISHRLTAEEANSALMESAINSVAGGEYKATKDAVKFYWYAYQRDMDMAENLFSEMSDRNLRNAVVVVGGFHSAGITSWLNKMGINVTVIAPQIPANAFDYDHLYIEKLLESYLAIPYRSDRSAKFAERIRQYREGKMPPGSGKSRLSSAVMALAMVATVMPFQTGVITASDRTFMAPPQITAPEDNWLSAFNDQRLAERFRPSKIADSALKPLSPKEKERLGVIRTLHSRYQVLFRDLGKPKGTPFVELIKRWNQLFAWQGLPKGYSLSIRDANDMWPKSGNHYTWLETLRKIYHGDVDKMISLGRGKSMTDLFMDLPVLLKLAEFSDGQLLNHEDFNRRHDHVFGLLKHSFWTLENVDAATFERAYTAQAYRLKIALGLLGLDSIMHVADWRLERILTNRHAQVDPADPKEIKTAFVKEQIQEEPEYQPPEVDPGILKKAEIPTPEPQGLAQDDDLKSPGLVTPGIAPETTRERLNRIERELRQLEADKGDGLSFHDRALILWRDIDTYWKAKASDILFAGFLVSQLLFVMALTGFATIKAVLARFGGKASAMTRRFPSLSGELGALWLVSLVGFLWSTIMNTESRLLSPAQVMFAISGTISAFMIWFKNMDSARARRDSGSAMVAPLVVVVATAILVPVLYQTRALAVLPIIAMTIPALLSGRGQESPSYNAQQHLYHQT